MYAVRHPIRRTRVRVVFFPRPQRLDVVCRSTGEEEAVVGGVFVRDPYRPLGEVWHPRLPRYSHRGTDRPGAAIPAEPPVPYREV